jgi:hypothetical protein
MTFLSELQACNFNPCGMFHKETVVLYWENRQIQRTRTDLINLWLNN